MRVRRAHLLLASLFVILGFGLWAAGTASANCNIDPTDPMCMPPPTQGTTPPNTSPPQTSPPVIQHSSSPGVMSTSPPVNRTPATNAPRRTSHAPVVAQTPATQPAEQFVPDTPAAVAPSPAIAVSGTAPPLGGGVASSSATPAGSSSSSGAGTVLWAFGIGIAAVGIAFGARATLAGGATSTAGPLQA